MTTAAANNPPTNRTIPIKTTTTFYPRINIRHIEATGFRLHFAIWLIGLGARIAAGFVDRENEEWRVVHIGDLGPGESIEVDLASEQPSSDAPSKA